MHRANTVFIPYKRGNCPIENGDNPSYLGASNNYGRMDTSAQLDESLMHSGQAFEMGFRAVGPSNIQIYPDPRQPVILILEPGNPFDKSAVATHNQDGFFGYISPEHNQGLAEYLENEKPYYAKIKLATEMAQTHSMKYLIAVYATELIAQCHEVLRVPTRG